MPIDIDFKDHTKVLVMIAEAQAANTDMRQGVRDAKLFLNKRDGQWDAYAWEKLEGRFRGTFDMCTPIVDQISGEIDQSDFSLIVSPAGGESSMDTAKIYNGLIRNIKNISNSEQVFNAASRSNVIGGFDAVEIVQDWVDGNTMDQDLIIKQIPNAVDSVWFDLGSVMQDASDARWAVKQVSIPTAEYKETYPKGSNLGVGDDRHSEAFFNKAESIIVGQLYYKKKVSVELVEMTNGAVYEVDDDFDKVKDELELAGIVIQLDNEGEERRRTRKSWRVHSRMFDGGGWLEDETETVFDSIPIIPIYGNFDIFENKSIYFGKIEKLYDQQRILNYAMSRDIEDGALSPSPFYWMTDKQIGENDYSTMNTDHHPVRTYDTDEEATGAPQWSGGVQVSTGLQTTIANTQQMISASANSFNALQGNANPNQSGIAGGQQIEQGNTGSIKWFESKKIMECQVGKVLLPAIPRVYSSTRQVRILEEDGTSSIVTLNEPVFDQQTQTNVELNDLSKGLYDVVCDYGPAFNSQQKETIQAFLDMAAIDPSFLQQGKDIMLKNLSVPGMDQMAERARVELLNAGMIPESQWTDEERAQIQAQQAAAKNQPPKEDPNMVLAKAEEGKAQAEQMNAQTKQQEAQFNAQVKSAEVAVDQDRVALSRETLQFDVQKFIKGQDDKFNVDAAKIQQGQQALDMKAQKDQFEVLFKQQQIQQQKINDAFNNLKVMREAMGVDAIVGPHSTKAYVEQAVIVDEIQEELPIDNNNNKGNDVGEV